MFTKLANIFNKTHRDFEAFQIEASTYSALECRICPATFSGEMDLSEYVYGDLRKDRPVFSSHQMGFLLRMGDPMENEHIFSMLRLAKEKGCLTGLSTNGTHLNDTLSGQLLSTVWI